MELERVGNDDNIGRRSGGERPQPPEPQKCPRCDSLNTKFCYYNNYSLSQPRYFCKTCRRYWTHGGTLRNVPVGGGCRKGKRPKHSPSNPSSSQNQNQNHLLQQPQSQKVVAPLIPTFYQGGSNSGVGDYLASLTSFNQLNQQNPFDQSLNLNIGGGGCSNLGLLQGFSNAAAASSIRPQQQFYQMGNGGGIEGVSSISSMYNNNNNTSQQGLNLMQSTMANTSSAHNLNDQHWSQSYMNNNNNGAANRATSSTIDASSLWNSTINSNTSLIGDHRSTVGAGSTSLVPNQWHDLQGLNHQGFHPHPPPQ